MTSLSFMISTSWPSIFTSVPDQLPNSTLSLGFRGTIFPSSPRAWTNSNDLALLGLLGRSIGDDDSPRGLGIAFDAAECDAIVEGTKVHVCSNANRPAYARAFGDNF